MLAKVFRFKKHKHRLYLPEQKKKQFQLQSKQSLKVVLVVIETVFLPVRALGKIEVRFTVSRMW